MERNERKSEASKCESTINDISWVKIPLPDDILRQKLAGHFEEARRIIDHMLSGFLPECMRMRLELEKKLMSFLNVEEYPFDREAALEKLKGEIRDFQEEELDQLVAASAADWIYLDGEVRFHKLFFDNIMKTRPDYEKRQIQKEADDDVDHADTTEDRKRMLDDNVAYMKEHGGRTARLTIRAALRLAPESEHPGEKIRVHLPIPQACRQNSEITILETSPEASYIAAETADQRTICFDTVLEKNQEFMVRYSFVNHVDYKIPDPAQALSTEPDNYRKDIPERCVPASDYLGEQAPHILFTPFMKELLKEIKKDETNPVVIARAIYDFITTRVKYSYVRAYAALDNISEYAAKNLKGDCGVQAILFITLCRLAGIPARWQSGLYATKFYTGCHDWAEFYVEPYGWLYADPSFGGSAYRSGNAERWNYYFGNLDIYRMAANSSMQSELDPPKSMFRADPVDNQSGEAEYLDRTEEKLQLLTDQTTESILEIE